MTRLPEEGEKEAPQAWSDGGTEPRVTSCVCVCVCVSLCPSNTQEGCTECGRREPVGGVWAARKQTCSFSSVGLPGEPLLTSRHWF